MKVISINVGMPKEVIWHGRTVLTSIFKEPVIGPVRVNTLNIEGDKQADLTVHGGVNKAVYTYPSEHYPYWKSNYPDLEDSWGLFGENLTLEGLLEKNVMIGDVFRIGTAEFSVTQPRMPCYKLAIRTGHNNILKRFYRSGRPGFYMNVIKEGLIENGAEIITIKKNYDSVSVTDIASLGISSEVDPKLVKRAAEIDTLGPEWRKLIYNLLN